jgi:uncharacterized membrane protein YGL010W
MSRIAEAAVSKFHKTPRRTAHLLTIYGFVLYVVATLLMLFVYPTTAATPPTVSTLWTVGAGTVVIGGLWYFYFMRTDVAHDGYPPYHFARANLFVDSLVNVMIVALLWRFVETTYRSTAAYIQ